MSYNELMLMALRIAKERGVRQQAEFDVIILEVFKTYA